MSSWWTVLKQLTAITLCTVLVDLMMPTGTMRKYARLVSGLILIYMLLRPISALFMGNPVTSANPGMDLLDTLIGQAEGTR